jgi:hypothetical protein
MGFPGLKPANKHELQTGNSSCPCQNPVRKSVRTGKQILAHIAKGTKAAEKVERKPQSKVQPGIF